VFLQHLQGTAMLQHQRQVGDVYGLRRHGWQLCCLQQQSLPSWQSVLCAVCQRQSLRWRPPVRLQHLQRRAMLQRLGSTIGVFDLQYEWFL